VTGEEGRPVAVEVVEGNTSDPATVAALLEKLKGRFGLCARWSWSTIGGC
jgi:hypothetical protein